MSNLQNTTNSPWKDHVGRWHVNALFLERSRIEETTPPHYTVHDTDIERDGVKYPSLKAIYLSYPHVPGYEYDFAQEHLGGWEHWQRLLNSSMRDIFKQWQDELTIKQKARALRGIISESLNATPTGFQANKYLVEDGWVEKKGRPTKEKVEHAAKVAAGVKEEIEDDLARVGLSLVKG